MVTEAMAVVAIIPIPLLQLQLTPEVVELPVSVAGVWVQVSCIGLADAVRFGFVVSMLTTTALVEKQPLAGLVTFTV